MPRAPRNASAWCRASSVRHSVIAEAQLTAQEQDQMVRIAGPAHFAEKTSLAQPMMFADIAISRRRSASQRNNGVHRIRCVTSKSLADRVWARPEVRTRPRRAPGHPSSTNSTAGARPLARSVAAAEWFVTPVLTTARRHARTRPPGGPFKTYTGRREDREAAQQVSTIRASPRYRSSPVR